MAQEGALPWPEHWRPSPPILSGLGQDRPGGRTLQEAGGPGWQNSQQNLLWKHTAGRLGPAAALSGGGASPLSRPHQLCLLMHPSVPSPLTLTLTVVWGMGSGPSLLYACSEAASAKIRRPGVLKPQELILSGSRGQKFSIQVWTRHAPSEGLGGGASSSQLPSVWPSRA